MGLANERGNRQYLKQIDPEAAKLSPSVYRVIVNRRQNVVRVILRDRDLPWASISRKGTSFLQRLPDAGGTCWALNGVRGS